MAESENSEEKNSILELSFGGNHLRIEGSESFIDDQLDVVLDRLEFSTDSGGSSQTQSSALDQSKEESSEHDLALEDFSSEDGVDATDIKSSEEPVQSEGKLRKVADEINADYEKLSEHFYVDEDGPGIHDPRNIESKYALLGFCVIEKVLTGKSTFGNREMKKRLTEDEMVPIENWGSQFLYNLRRQGVIKNDPNSDKSRNVPFKLKPQGIHEFVDWLNEQNNID